MRIEKIKTFLIANQTLRKIKIFFRQILAPIFFKIFVAITALIIATLVLIKIFKPDYIEKIYQKSSFYFFHYLNLDNHQFSKINVSGNKRISKEEILSIVYEIEKDAKNYTGEDYQPMIDKISKSIKQNLPWSDKVVITRSMPSILNISITEYEPFAIWQNDGKTYITDKDGNLVPIKDLEEFKNFVILTGKNANLHAKSLFNIFTIDENLSKNVYSATWISDRRWDIRFENGLIIKLPEGNINEAWKRLIKIFNSPESVSGLKIIDLRIDDKIYFQYDDSAIKEIKNL